MQIRVAGFLGIAVEARDAVLQNIRRDHKLFFPKTNLDIDAKIYSIRLNGNSR